LKIWTFVKKRIQNNDEQPEEDLESQSVEEEREESDKNEEKIIS